MKKLIIFIFFLAKTYSYSQFSVSAGMGFNIINTPSFTQYINTNFATPGNRLSDFNGAIEFFGELSYPLTDEYAISLDYSNVIYSFNTASYVGNYDISYIHLKPSLLAYYVLSGPGYQFKFGGGVGVRFVSLDEKLPNITVTNNYKSTGYGIVLRSSGNTILSSDMYANISVDFRYDLPGNLKGNKYLYDFINKSEVNLNGISFAVKLGITYFI
jgi:hypothetical protein